ATLPWVRSSPLEGSQRMERVRQAAPTRVQVRSLPLEGSQLPGKCERPCGAPVPVRDRNQLHLPTYQTLTDPGPLINPLEGSQHRYPFTIRAALSSAHYPYRDRNISRS